jgi:glucose-1-phosphate adenylyltransferase
MKDRSEINRFGLVSMTDDNRVTNIDEKPLETSLSMVSTGVYVIRRRMLIELLEKAAEEDRHEFVRDILVRYKNIKKIYAYELKDYWANISTVNAYFKTNMDFLKKDVRDYFFHQYPDVYSKVEDLPPAKYNFGAHVKNSLISSGCIVNGTIENSVLFKKVYVGNNAVIKNSIILNNAYIGDNAYIENCIVESNSTIKADSKFIGEHEVQIVREDNPIYM